MLGRKNSSSDLFAKFSSSSTSADSEKIFIKSDDEASSLLWGVVKATAILGMITVGFYGVLKFVRYMFPGKSDGKALPASFAPTQLTLTFEDRLHKAGYSGPIPDWAADPVFFQPMDNPVLLKTRSMCDEKLYTSKTYDLSTVVEIRNGKCPLTREPFNGYLANEPLKFAIKEWVERVEGKIKDTSKNRSIEEKTKRMTEKLKVQSATTADEKLFAMRLEECGYMKLRNENSAAIDEFPQWLLDPVTKKIMENPVFLNTEGKETCTVDLSTISLLNNIHPVTKEPMSGYAKNRELLEAIEFWVVRMEMKMQKKSGLVATNSMFAKPGSKIGDLPEGAPEDPGDMLRASM